MTLMRRSPISTLLSPPRRENFSQFDQYKKICSPLGHNGMRNARRQGIYWICTIPEHEFRAPGRTPEPVSWMCGQLECGLESGYRHWQIYVALARKGSIRTLQEIFGQAGHYELTRSVAAEEYCLKEDSRVEGTQFR